MKKKKDVQAAAANDKDLVATDTSGAAISKPNAAEVLAKIDKKDKKKYPDIVETTDKRTVQAKYNYNEKELKDIAGKLAQREVELNEKEEEKKSVMARYTDGIKAAKLDVKTLSRKYRDRWEYRDYECIVIYDYKKKEKRFKELGTGKIVEIVPFGPGEEQKRFL